MMAVTTRKREQWHRPLDGSIASLPPQFSQLFGTEAVIYSLSVPELLDLLGVLAQDLRLAQSGRSMGLKLLLSGVKVCEGLVIESLLFEESGLNVTTILSSVRGYRMF